MATKTTTTLVALGALAAGAIGGSTLLPSADAADVSIPECADITAEGGDCTKELRSAARVRVKRLKAIKRAKVIGVLDWIRLNKPAKWSQIMTAVNTHWDDAYPPEPKE